MRYSCSVCGMNHSRPCDAGLECGILKGVPMKIEKRASLLKSVMQKLAALAQGLPPATKSD